MAFDRTTADASPFRIELVEGVSAFAAGPVIDHDMTTEVRVLLAQWMNIEGVGRNLRYVDR